MILRKGEIINMASAATFFGDIPRPFTDEILRDPNEERLERLDRENRQLRSDVSNLRQRLETQTANSMINAIVEDHQNRPVIAAPVEVEQPSKRSMSPVTEFFD